MRSLGRNLLWALCVLIAMASAVGIPRLWHAHSSADPEHDHSTASSHAARHGHTHSHDHGHDHSHGHKHSHTHGHSHGHSHRPTHSHSPGHSHRAVSEDDFDGEAVVVRHTGEQWHLHLSFFGWTFTVWGSEAAPRSSSAVLAQHDHDITPARSRRQREPIDDGATTVSAAGFDWLANWDATIILVPLQRSRTGLPFDPSLQFAVLDNDSPLSMDLQPPVPPPRPIFDTQA